MFSLLQNGGGSLMECKAGASVVGIFPSIESLNLSEAQNKVYSMNKKEGLEVAIGTSRRFLKYLGIWSHLEQKGSLLFRGWFLIPAIIMSVFTNIPQTLFIAKIWRDLNAVLEVLTVANIPTGLALLKMLGLWSNRKVLGQLVVIMSEDWNNTEIQQQLQVMWKHAKLSRLISITLMSVTWCTIILHFIMYVRLSFKELKEYHSNEFNVTKRFRPYYTKSEFIFNFQKTPLFEISLVGQCLSSFFAASAFWSVDGFFAVLVLHLCGQLKNLRDMIKRLPKEVTSSKENGTFVKSVTMIISKHNRLYRFANDIENAFNFVFLFQMILSSMVLCLQGYQIVKITTKGNGIQLLELSFMIYYTISFTSSLFMYCYIAEVLRTESMELGNAAYESDWYNLQPVQVRILILIIVRARKPFEITAGKFVAFSLALYASILKSSGGYLSMLLAMKDRLAE